MQNGKYYTYFKSVNKICFFVQNAKCLYLIFKWMILQIYEIKNNN